MASGDLIRIGGGADFSKITPVLYHRTSYGAEYTEILNISGSGFLFSILQSTSNVGYIRLEIDGQIVLDGVLLSYGDSLGTLVHIYKFNNSLKISCRSNSGGATVNTTISYGLV